MYRVELKDCMPTPVSSIATVPNVPCGVERTTEVSYDKFFPWLFLMYRVELKAVPASVGLGWVCLVPNVPCGVER